MPKKYQKLAWVALAMWVVYLEFIALVFWALFGANFLIAQPIILVMSLIIVGLTFINKAEIEEAFAEETEDSEKKK